MIYFIGIIVDGGRKMPFVQSLYQNAITICNTPTVLGSYEEKGIEDYLFQKVPTGNITHIYQSTGKFQYSRKRNPRYGRFYESYYHETTYGKSQLQSAVITIDDVIDSKNCNGYKDDHMVRTDLVYLDSSNNTYHLIELKFPTLSGSGSYPKYKLNYLTQQPTNISSFYGTNIFDDVFYSKSNNKFMTDEGAGQILIEFLRFLAHYSFNKDINNNFEMYFMCFLENHYYSTTDKTNFTKNLSFILDEFIDMNNTISNTTFCMTQGKVCAHCKKARDDHDKSKCSNGNFDPEVGVWPMRPCKLSYFDGTNLNSNGTPTITPVTSGNPIHFFYDASDPKYGGTAPTGTPPPNNLFCFLIKVEPL